MKVLFCASEVVPFAKTGGLADVAGALPQALEKLGAEVKVAMPKYRSLKELRPIVKMGKNIDILLVANNNFYDRDGLYGEATGDYPDNLERFAFFCKQTLQFVQDIGFEPDIIHCNDWQTALLPIYLKTTHNALDFLKNTQSILTVHNLAYQGLFPSDQYQLTGLDDSLFSVAGLEYHGKVNLLKGGLLFADFITTVSSTYAQEIQTQALGCGLEGILKARKDNVFGILNGLDYANWDPNKDLFLFKKFDASNLDAKYENKLKLQQQFQLEINKDIPLIGVVSRFAQQKGIELVISCLDKIAKSKAQLILLGSGDEKYHTLLKKVVAKNYKNISIHMRFDNGLAHKVYAASDMFLMPSHYEPCGLGQLISFKYGAVPIVRKTGGLADTVSDIDESADSGRGFVFKDFNAGSLFKAIQRALSAYDDKKTWQELVIRIMGLDFSWDISAKKYISLYEKAINDKK